MLNAYWSPSGLFNAALDFSAQAYIASNRRMMNWTTSESERSQLIWKEYFRIYFKELGKGSEKL